MKKFFVIASIIIVLILAIGGIFLWKAYQSYMTVEIIKYDPLLTIYLGGGGNSVVLVSPDGTEALVIDTKMGIAAKKLHDNLKAANISIINTHNHSDHTEGNNLYRALKIISGDYTHEQWNKAAGKSRFPDMVIKAGEERVIAIGDEKVHLQNMGMAHTWSDIIVYFEKRKLMVTGDLVFLNIHPVLRKDFGSNVSSWICALDVLSRRYDIKTLVPGHGSVTDKSAIMAMKDYFVSIGDATGNKDKQAILETRYKKYFSIPGMSNLSKTMAYIEDERKTIINN